MKVMHTLHFLVDLLQVFCQIINLPIAKITQFFSFTTWLWIKLYSFVYVLGHYREQHMSVKGWQHEAIHIIYYTIHTFQYVTYT